MLQRIQTVFLIIAVAALGSMFLFPVWVKANPESGELHQLSALYYKHIPAQASEASFEYMPFALIGILAVAAIFIAIMEITRFNNRLLQMKLGALNSLLMSGVLGCCVYFTFKGQEAWLPEIVGEYQLGMFLPAIAMVCNVIANRFIRRDEKLVRSVDRIR